MAEEQQVAEWYRLLDLPYGASREEVKAAWRDLVKIWHPDRFTHEPHLQRRCQEKLKQINEAYERLQGMDGLPRQLVEPEFRRCARCGRAISPHDQFCGPCAVDLDEERLVREAARTLVTPSLRPVLGAVLGLVVLTVLLQWAMEGLQNTWWYLALLLGGLAGLRQLYFRWP